MKFFKGIITLFKTVIKKIILKPELLLQPGTNIKRFVALLTRYIHINQPAVQADYSSIVSDSLIYQPRISVVSLRINRNTESNLANQLYPHFERIEIDSLTQIRQAVDSANGEYILFTQSDDVLYPDTLFRLIEFIGNTGEKPPHMIFADHSYSDKGEREEPFYKPGWSPDLFMVNNYVYRACLITLESVKAYLSEDGFEHLSSYVYDINMKVAENGTIVHCPKILFSYPKKSTDRFAVEEALVRQLLLDRRGEKAMVTCNQYHVPTITRMLSERPLVSIIIATCFKENYIFSCLQSILSKTTYDNYQLIILDNSRQKQDYGTELLKEYDCKVISLDIPFNWAQFNNIGVTHAEGDVLVFLNDDTEIITPTWLESLVAQAVRPEIGVAGPLLLYPNGTVQHAGMFLIDHSPGVQHCFVGLPENYAGYHNLLHYQRNCVALTGACQAISRKKFLEMNGFDEKFSIVANDVDLCLRLWQKGYLNVYVPEVQVTHKELASRRGISEDKDLSMFWKRWSELLIQGDPYFKNSASLEYLNWDVFI